MFVSVSAATGNKKSKNIHRHSDDPKPIKITTWDKISMFVFKIRAQSLYVPNTYSVDVERGLAKSKENDKKTFKLSFLQKIFLLLDDPLSCSLAVLYQILMLFVIIVSCFVYVASTLPSLMHQPSSCSNPACDNDPDVCPDSVICEPEPLPALNSTEIFCLVVFTVDYVSRVAISPLMPSRLSRILPPEFDTKTNIAGLLPDPEYPWYERVGRYVVKDMNIIDFLAIVPSFIALGVQQGPSVSIVRILRLARIFRVFKIGGMSTGLPLFSKTVTRALPAVSIMFFFSALAILCFGSVMYYLESGNFVVNNLYPEGAYVRWNSLRSDKEESPFKSILHACYWAIVTMTTVGYGDLVPTSPFGRTFAVLFMYMGIILLALPISVVGSSFQREYAKLYPEEPNDEDTDDEDERGTELDGISSSERRDIKKSLAELNDKVTFLMEAMMQLQKQQQQGKWPLDASRSSGDIINVLHKSGIEDDHLY